MTAEPKQFVALIFDRSDPERPEKVMFVLIPDLTFTGAVDQARNMVEADSDLLCVIAGEHADEVTRHLSGANSGQRVN